MGASASVPGHPQPLNLSQTLPSMTEWSGHALQQLSPPPPVQHAGGRPPFTTPTLESMGALVGACCRCSCWCKSLLGGTPRSQCWVTSLWTAHHPWWCSGYTEPPSRHSLPGIPIQKVPGHRNTGVPPRTPGKSVLERRFKFQDLIQRMLITGAEASHQGAACSGGTSLAASSGRDKAQRHHLPKEVL